MRESFLQWKVSGTIDWNIYIYIKLVGEMNPDTLDLIQVYVYTHSYVHLGYSRQLAVVHNVLVAIGATTNNKNRRK